MSRSTATPASRRERRAAARLDRPARARSRARVAARPAWRSPAVLVTAAALVVGAVLVALALPKGTADERELRFPPTTYEDGLTAGDVLGSPDAPVVMQLYSDFQCPACERFVTMQLPGLVAEFVRPGTLRIEARDIAFLGGGSFDESLELATGAACAAEQDRYWEFHDLVFWNQGRENRGDHDAAFIGRIADRSVPDRAAFDACVAAGAERDTVRSETSAALAAGIGSTPTLIVNGQKLVGVQDYGQLAALISSLAAPSSPAPSPS